MAKKTETQLPVISKEYLKDLVKIICTPKNDLEIMAFFLEIGATLICSHVNRLGHTVTVWKKPQKD